ncbi:MAG: hypothetical protein A4E45_01760 [Methanosaeta sp. PtaB.Bin039]|nr:MAG: hypothetical protein A4E45_01760 [Methanosaeta sp. PtaB.Bin039]
MKPMAYAVAPSLWAREALGFVPDQKQAEILDSSNKRIIINCHRQWGKSTISAIICLHRALFWPESLCLITAPALRQSSENFRKIISFLDGMDESPGLVEDTKLTLQLNNKSRILCLPGGSDGRTIRGFSAPDLIIEDESSRCSEELHLALLPMLARKPHSRLILASTPWGQRGHFFKTWAEGQGWQKVELRASENPRISPEYLEEMQATMSPWDFAQEFECEFVASESQLISEEMIQRALNPDIELIPFGDA